MVLQSLCACFNATVFLGYVSKQITQLPSLFLKGYIGSYHMKYTCGILKSKFMLYQRHHGFTARAWARSKTNLRIN